MIDQLPYAAPLVYSPRGTSEVSRTSQQLRDAIKGARPDILTRVAAFVARLDQQGRFPGFFGPDVVLVPVPGSAPRKDPTTLWVAERIAQVLHAQGLGASVWNPIQRVGAVQKSATAGRGNRPTVPTHEASMHVTELLAPGRCVLLVDDFVTKGRTMLAAARVLDAAVPGLDLKGFALVRTMGLQQDIERIDGPVVGTITWNGDANRVP